MTKAFVIKMVGKDLYIGTFNGEECITRIGRAYLFSTHNGAERAIADLYLNSAEHVPYVQSVNIEFDTTGERVCIRRHLA